MTKANSAALGFMLCAVALSASARQDEGGSIHTVPVLEYHKLGAPSEAVPDPGCIEKSAPGPDIMTVSYADFKCQMEWLRDHHYRTLSMGEAFGDHHVDLQPTDVVITFDDGYEDNFAAFELLWEMNKAINDPRRKLKATLFMVSDNIGKDENHLSQEQLRSMDEGGFKVEDHSKDHHTNCAESHPCTRGNREEQTKEYGESKKTLEAALGHPVEYAAYPGGGGDDPEVWEITLLVMRGLGYKAAFIGGDKVADLNGERLKLDRFWVKDNATFLRAIHEGLKAALHGSASASAARSRP